VNASQAKKRNSNVACLAHHMMNDCERYLITVKQAVRGEANQMQLRFQNVKDAVMLSAVHPTTLSAEVAWCLHRSDQNAGT
jgi:hypothetical protein